MNIFSMLLHLIIILLFLAVVYRKTSKELRVHLIISVILKCAAGTAYGLYFMYVLGSGDTLLYHEEAESLSNWARSNPGDYLNYLLEGGETPFVSHFSDSPRAEWYSRWVSVFHLITGSSYWMTSLYFSILAWSGFWALAMTLIKRYTGQKPAILFSLLYFPSILFWTSGISKESLALAFLTGTLALILSKDSNKILRMAFVALLLVMLWQLKYYYAAVFLISVCVSYLLFTQRVRISIALRFMLCLVLLPAGIWGLSLLHPNFDLTIFPSVVYDNYLLLSERSLPGRSITFDTLCAEWPCLIVTLPFAIFSGLFLPLPFQFWNTMSLLAGLENLLLLVLSLSAVIYYLRNRTGLGVSYWQLTWLIYCLILAGFLAMSAPNYGTLMRYRVGFLPLFVLLITMNNGYFYRILNFFHRRVKK